MVYICPLIPEMKPGDILYAWGEDNPEFYLWAPSRNKMFYLAMLLPQSPIWVETSNLMIDHIPLWRVVYANPDPF